MFRLGRDCVEFERCCLTRRRGGAEKHAENIFSGLVSVLARLRRKVKTCERGDSGDRTASQRGSRWGGGLTNAARGLRLPTVASGSGSRGVREMLLDAETRRRGETRGEHLFRIGFRACKATQESQNLRARRQRRSYGFAARLTLGWKADQRSARRIPQLVWCISMLAGGGKTWTQRFLRTSRSARRLFPLGRDSVEFERCCLTRRRGGAETAEIVRLRSEGSRWGGRLTKTARGGFRSWSGAFRCWQGEGRHGPNIRFLRTSRSARRLFRLGRDRVEFERCCLTRRRGGAEKHAENIFSGLVSELARLCRKVKTWERGDSGDHTASQRGSRWGGRLTNAARGGYRSEEHTSELQSP